VISRIIFIRINLFTGRNLISVTVQKLVYMFPFLKLKGMSVGLELC